MRINVTNVFYVSNKDKKECSMSNYLMKEFMDIDCCVYLINQINECMHTHMIWKTHSSLYDTSEKETFFIKKLIITWIIYTIIINNKTNKSFFLLTTNDFI